MVKEETGVKGEGGIGRQEVVRGLVELGVEKGDTLFVHASYKSLGKVHGGAAAVIGAMEDAVGEEGLLLMPSFNLVEGGRRAATWDIAQTPSTVGWLTEFMWRQPGTWRSDHYSHSVAARGQGAAQFVAEHRRREGLASPWDLEPWGKTYGTHSPMYRAYERGGKLLMLGVGYDSSTYIHLVEVMCWARLRQEDADAKYPALERPGLGAWWDQQGRLVRGQVGAADCRLFGIAEYVDALYGKALKDLGISS